MDAHQPVDNTVRVENPGAASKRRTHTPNRKSNSSSSSGSTRGKVEVIEESVPKTEYDALKKKVGGAAGDFETPAISTRNSERAAGSARCNQ